MNKVLAFSIIFVSGEIVATFLFMGLTRFFSNGEQPNKAYTLLALLKGILERFLLFFAFTYSIFLVLTFFGAIKIGTRLEVDKKDKVSNDYFLVGNFISVLLAFIYYVIYVKMVIS
jgi:hypothetical protein